MNPIKEKILTAYSNAFITSSRVEDLPDDLLEDAWENGLTYSDLKEIILSIH